MNKVNIVGIAGRAGAGKDTAADYLVKRFAFKRFAFADAIRDGIKAIFGLTDAELNDRILKEKEIPWIGRSPRYLAQRLGTEFGRNQVQDDIWIRVLSERVRRSQWHQVVISDVRFENEAAWIRSQGGQIIHIKRPGDEISESGHPSENGIAVMPGDLVIDNASTLAFLHDELEYTQVDF